MTVTGQRFAEPPSSPSLCIAACFSRYSEAREWARLRLQQAWGAIVLESPLFDFEYTTYYEPTMGPGISKVLWAFEEATPQVQLAGLKCQSIQWEAEYAESAGHPEPRPLNIDPGYVTEAKLVLATTKDRDHRIYLRDGIFAEVTLSYRNGGWAKHPWTYPDYQSEEYQRFFRSVAATFADESELKRIRFVVRMGCQ